MICSQELELFSCDESNATILPYFPHVQDHIARMHKQQETLGTSLDLEPRKTCNHKWHVISLIQFILIHGNMTSKSGTDPRNYLRRLQPANQQIFTKIGNSMVIDGDLSQYIQ